MSENEFIKSKIIARTLLHSAYIENLSNKSNSDALVVSEIVEYDNGLITPNLRVFESPSVPFWITQPVNRTHTDKKEFESVDRLDKREALFKEKDREIFRALNGYSPNFISPKMRRELYQSPYLYGANISLEALVAMKYKKDLAKAGKTPHSPTTGFFDIEKSLLPSSYGKLPLMVFTAENHVYLAMKRSFMNEMQGGSRVDVSQEDVEKAAHDIIDPLVDSIFTDLKDLKEYKGKLPFKYHFFVGDTEVDMIRWIFARMHQSKTSFIGIWNLGFDIPEIISVLNENGIPLNEIFSDPSLKELGCSYANFREDKRDVAHFTQKWHWLTTAAHFQFIDSMALFSYVRMVDGKESSYALDDILKKYGLGGKLKFKNDEELAHLQQEDWHREMLGKYFTRYALYAMWDGISLQILEWLNNDLTAMMLLSDISPPKNFVNQTIRVTNTLYDEWKEKGQILGTGVDVEGIKDDDLLDGGGAVLEPQNLVARGMCLFEEWPKHATHCYAWQSDLDFSAQYPTNISVVNISKQTKLGTITAITAPWVQTRYKPADAIEIFCSYLVTPNSNGRELGVEFFGLYDFDEMNEAFVKHLEKTGL
jgi:hypothetical protein